MDELLSIPRTKSPLKSLIVELTKRAQRFAAVVHPSTEKQLFKTRYLVVHSIFVAARIVELWPQRASEQLIVMTHSPEWRINELILDQLVDTETTHFSEDPCVVVFRDFERATLQAATATLWPCVSSAEGYPGFEIAEAAQNRRVLFAMTGTEQPRPFESREAMRARWMVGASDRVVLFVGRPHAHKGFDRFLETARIASVRGDRQTIFLHVGPPPRRIATFKPILYAGYTEDVTAAMGAADVVLNLNRASYLDLSLLQAMSVGVSTIVSPTGGHKSVLTSCPHLHIAPETPEEIWEQILQLPEPSPDERNALQKCWLSHFTLKDMIENHLAAYQSLPT